MAKTGTNWAPTTRQAVLFEKAIESGTGRKVVKICKEAKVPLRTFYNWMADPGFRDAWNQLWQQILDLHFNAVMAAQVEKAMSGQEGSTAAARLLAEMKGVIRKRVEVSGPDGGPVHTVDFARMTTVELEVMAKLHPEYSKRLAPASKTIVDAEVISSDDEEGDER